jgi:glutamyl-tRNA reductase
MEKQNIAVIGLGRVGSIFLERLLQLQDHGINLTCVVELQETPGKQLARQAGVKLLELDEMMNLSHEIEIIFDLTGNEDVKHTLREKLVAIGNHYTIIAPENIARLIWNVMGNSAPLPDYHRQKGY